MEEFELEPGEEIIAQVRQHLFVLLLRLLPYLLLAAAPLVIAPVFSFVRSANPELLISDGGALSPSFRFFLGVWWLFAWMGLFQVLTKYFLTSWVITSHRIVDIYQKGFFRRKVSSFLLVRVQDITTNVHGVLATLIGFGDINVETAGSAEEFQMKGIRHPEFVRDLIMREVALLHAKDDSAKTGV